MTSQPTIVDELKVDIAKDGTATLSGINYGDLRDILTAASLYRYDNKPKIKPLDNGNYNDVIHSNNKEAIAWHLHQRLILDVIEARMSEAISPEYSNARRPVESAKKSYEYEISDLDHTVSRMEAKAAQQADTVDPTKEAVNTLQIALQQANAALAKLNQLHAKSY